MYIYIYEFIGKLLTFDNTVKPVIVDAAIREHLVNVNTFPIHRTRSIQITYRGTCIYEHCHLVNVNDIVWNSRTVLPVKPTANVNTSAIQRTYTIY